MDLHDRYLHFPTPDISVILTVNNETDKFLALHRLIQFYNQEITRKILDMSKLETYRMLLCYEYQLVFNDNDERHMLPIKETICFPSVEAIFLTQHLRSPIEILVLRDIIILQMVLYYNTKSVEQHLQSFLIEHNAYITELENTRVMYMKVLEYFLDTLHLHRFLHGDDWNDNEEKLSSMCLKVLKSWIRVKEESEWRLFVSTFPKLVNTFALTSFLFPLWDFILNETSDLKDSLTALSIMADICFAVSSKHSIVPTHIQRDVFSNNAFWLLILDGLRSPSRSSRKQALYLMRRAMDSMSEVCISSLELTRARLAPFICGKSNNSVRQKFFLVYEALEEKQYHLVGPALAHLNDLTNVNRDHVEFCGDCFNVAWLRCILEKVLLHENNHVVKWGVSFVCIVGTLVFDDRFLELFVNVINNTYLYSIYEDRPEIVISLSRLFLQESGADLLKRFLKRASEVAWGPIAIFYVLHTLRFISFDDTLQSSWGAVELSAVKTLVETSLCKHSHVLRIASQIELLIAITNYVRKIDDLTSVANILAAFPYGEAKSWNTSWDVIVKWLWMVLKKENAITFVKDTCARYRHENADTKLNSKTFALMVLLLHDANFILWKTCPAERALDNWLHSLNDIDARPYADIRSNIDAIEFILHVMNFLTKIHTFSLTKIHTSSLPLITRYIYNTFRFLIKYMRKMSAQLTYEDYIRYTDIVSLHVANARSFVSEKDADYYVKELQNESITLLKNLGECQSMQYLYGLRILYISQDTLSLPQAAEFYMKYLINENLAPQMFLVHVNDDKLNLRGKIVSEYYLLLVKLMQQYLMYSLKHQSEIPVVTLLSKLSKFLELGGTEIISEIAKILIVMVDNQLTIEENDQETLKYIFQLCWKNTFLGNKNNIFWAAVENLTGVIVNEKFFLHFNDAMEFATKFISQLTEEGDKTSKFKNILLSKMAKLDGPDLIRLKKPLLDCLLHGSVLRRDKRIENQAHLFITNNLGNYYSRPILKLIHNDTAVRAMAITQLQKIIITKEHATEFTLFILEMLEKYKNKRYFNDSHLHKLKHRLMQILLMLVSNLDERSADLLQKKLRDFISTESNQHSVRLMQEWLMILIFQKNINLHDELWKFFEESIAKRPTCTISAASIVYHVAQLLSHNRKKVFIRAAMQYITQCCLSQQFNVRLYNQFILIELYKLMEVIKDESILEYKAIYNAAEANLQLGSSAKNSIRIQDDFYFTKFSPIRDYSLQTIYFELPRLTNISCDEWIEPKMFQTFMHADNFEPFIKLYNLNSILSNINASMYLTKSHADTDSLASNIDTSSKSSHDIQKKIDPLKSIVPLFTDILEEASIRQHDLQLHEEEGLIVVASFVDRLPNLGGIARTCEVFGVKALVIENLSHTNVKEFQCVSVTSEKWINMLQIKPHELPEYLLEKKNTGWTLVGVEQTANSVNLLETKFEKKTVLILGNEKDGIPANFIPLFDMCVEIPQMGVIRSLNVHVTAAICMWHYTSQHKLK